MQHIGVLDSLVGDEAFGDRDDLVGAMRSEAGLATGPHGILDPRAPPQTIGMTGQLLDHGVDREAGEVSKLLSDNGRLELALGRDSDVLEVAATTSARPGIRAWWYDAIRGRPDDLDGVRPQESVTRLPLRDLGDHLLTREGMAHEEDATVVPSDAVSPVGNRADRDDHAVTDPELTLGGTQGHGVPRRTSPAIGRSSMRSSAPSDEANCQGTLDTMTPGVKSKRVRRRSALWLWRICSHQ